MFPRNACRAALFIFAWYVPVASYAGADEDLARAAKSPYEIARFVDSHVTFHWEPLWKALGIQKDDVVIQPCGVMAGPERDCSVELVTVLDPFQVILILRSSRIAPEVYLRFLRASGPDRPGPWKFGGHYCPPVMDFEPQHRTLRFGKKPFLVVTRQGISGSSWVSEVEDWLDLSLPKFEPVFSLTTKRGHHSELRDHVGLETSAGVVSMESDPPERIGVSYSARFMDNDDAIRSYRSDNATYSRRGDMFVFDASRSKTSASDIHNLYNNDTESPSNEDYLRYFLADLKGIATRPDGERKEWLKRFLETCNDTVEKRELRALLTKAPPKQ